MGPNCCMLAAGTPARTSHTARTQLPPPQFAYVLSLLQAVNLGGGLYQNNRTSAVTSAIFADNTATQAFAGQVLPFFLHVTFCWLAGWLSICRLMSCCCCRCCCCRLHAEASMGVKYALVTNAIVCLPSGLPSQ